MTRLSGYFLPTERQAPADAEALSHKLSVRAGLARQVGAGLWSWLPAGWRVHQKVVQIVREEIDAMGGQEMLMPLITPAELWKRSGRYEIDEVFKLRDRRDAELVLAMTHEETVTLHVANAVKSYRDLPLVLYHFQTKGRDEPRPRAGVLRTREFIMKDAYTFDRDVDGPRRAPTSAWRRLRPHLRPLRPGVVRGGVRRRAMGGTGAHEYMAPCPAGENDVALAPGYAANVEVASADPRPVPPLDGLDGELHTPGHDDDRAGRRRPRHRPGRPAQGVSGRHGVARAAARLRARRPPRQRDQADQRARRAVPRRRPRTSCGGPRRLIGPGEGVAVLLDDAVARGRLGRGRQPARPPLVVERP